MYIWPLSPSINTPHCHCLPPAMRKLFLSDNFNSLKTMRLDMSRIHIFLQRKPAASKNGKRLIACVFLVNHEVKLFKVSDLAAGLKLTRTLVLNLPCSNQANFDAFYHTSKERDSTVLRLLYKSEVHSLLK
ncbi:EF-hand calcium-binding domain-containing protein 12 [Platysternon megacephalum]|uniref:EF-hand calcium-binding domain-containing protein 12 n=1 Tax=Platysternon megacephalum TaxID=55544 RepID=A0A4D9EAI5_9SAUR|nr:EF-hand calcium-binding domain-containing protein 12 [Platysternon megacephalum]